MEGGELTPGCSPVLLANADRLPVRVVCWNQSMNIAEVQGLGLPRVGGCICADGELDARTAALFEQHRRSLELIRFQFASLELPLADPSASPDRIVREVLSKSFPQVKATMTRLPTRAPPDVEVWKWRCSMKGAVEEIRWAAQLLLQKGLFVRPSPAEPVKLELDEEQRRGQLAFVGHHIRLREVPVPRLPEMPTGPDVLAPRIDPLAKEIRRLHGEIAGLRRRVQDILIFEARVEAMRQVISKLESLTRGGGDPFRAFTPLLDLELVRYETLVHDGHEVAIRAAVPSESAREASVRWLSRLRRRDLRHRFVALHPMYGEPAVRKIALPEGASTAGGRRCSLRLAGARAIDIGAASGASAVVAIGPHQALVSGEVDRAPLRQGLAAAAQQGGLDLLWDREALLLVPRQRSADARRSLSEGRQAGGPRITLQQPKGTLPQALGLVRRASRTAIAAPAETMASTVGAALAGRTSVGGWLRLLGAGLGLRLERGSGWELRPAGKGPVRLVPLDESARSPRTAAPESASLAQLRPRLLLACGGTARAIMAAAGGVPFAVRKGTRLGRGRSLVTSVDRRGVTVRWSDSGISAAVLLPFGEERPAAPEPTGQPGPPARAPGRQGR
jgi:hypothetical protein